VSLQLKLFVTYKSSVTGFAVIFQVVAPEVIAAVTHDIAASVEEVIA
jgi:hypothetical protein